MARNFSSTLNFGPNTDALFRTLGLFLSNVFQSGGFTKTADTGQIDWTTVTWPAGNNTSAGYEIRVFSDSLQATAPVYVKIEYGRGVADAYIGIWLTIGTASDGAGSISGYTILTRTQVSGNQAVGAGSATNCMVSSKTDYFVYHLGGNLASCQFVGLERTKNSSGNSTADGLLLTYRFASSGNIVARYLPYTGTRGPVPVAESGTAVGGVLMPASATSAVKGSNVAIFPFYFFGIGKTLNPGTLFHAAFSADMPGVHSTITATINGVSRDLMNMSQVNLGAWYTRNQVPAASVTHLLVLYET